MMPFDILHLLGTAEEENAAISRIVAQLAKRLDRRRYRIHAWFLGPDGPLAEELRGTGARVRVIRWPGGIRDPLGACRFWNALSGAKFSIVHQHFGGRSPRWLVRAKRCTKIITHLHGYTSESNSALPIQATRVHGADLAIAISRAVAEHAVGVETRIIYTGVVTPDRQAPTDIKAENVLGTACRLVLTKGVIHLVRAMALLRAEFPELRLEIAGAGPHRPTLENEVRLLGLNDRVSFLGWRSDISSTMSGWDIFVLPSLAEGLGVAALEAMAHGLPVVASAVGGLRELVMHGETGLLVPPSDPAALAGRVSELLVNSERRRAMGVAGLKRVREHFSAERMVMEIAHIYEEMLKSCR